MYQERRGYEIRIAMLVTRMDIGGVPDHIMTLLDGFGPNINVTVVTDNIHPDHQEILEKTGISIHLLPMSRLLDLRADFRTLRELSQFLKAGKFDILHTHMSKPALLGALIGAFSRKVIVVNTAHNLGFIALPQRWKRVIFWAYDKFIAAMGIDATITVSQKVADVVVDTRIIAEDKVHAIPNGIRLQDFTKNSTTSSNFRKQILGDGDQGKLVICVARLVWFKGIDTLIDAFKIVSQQHPGARLAIIGDGELKEALESQTKSLGLEKIVQFCGERRDIPAILSASDLFVLSSVSEGLPISILEAMAAHLPIVATDVGGVGELVLPGETGSLVSVGNGEKLAEALLWHLGNPDLSQEQGRAGFHRLNTEFSQQAMVTRTELLYRQLVNGNATETTDA